MPTQSRTNYATAVTFTVLNAGYADKSIWANAQMFASQPIKSTTTSFARLPSSGHVQWFAHARYVGRVAINI